MRNTYLSSTSPTALLEVSALTDFAQLGREVDAEKVEGPSSSINLQASISNRHLSIIDDQSSRIDHKSSIIHHRPSTVNRQSPEIKIELFGNAKRGKSNETTMGVRLLPKSVRAAKAAAMQDKRARAELQ